jgi:hypothetical protein
MLIEHGGRASSIEARANGKSAFGKNWVDVKVDKTERGYFQQLAASGNFSWSRWDNINGHRVAVVDYRLVYDIPRREVQRFGWPARVADWGYICFDPHSVVIWRISNAEVPHGGMAGILDSGLVTIGSKEFMVPVAKNCFTATERDNVIWYDYQEFGADSRIT